MDETISNPPPPESQPTATPRRGPWDWLKDDPNFPSAKPLAAQRRPPIFRQSLLRWFRPRLFRSTWFFLLLACAALALLEIPGRRTGFTTYAHGWPFAYMRRDYRQAQNFVNGELWTMHGWLDGLGGKHWIDTDPAAIDSNQEVFARDGFPLVYEQQMSPWSAADATMFSELALAADIVLTILLLIGVGGAAQRWRRRRIAAGRRWAFQFRLRTLLVAVAVLGPIMGLILPWYQDYRRDRSAADEIRDKGNVGVNQSVIHWLPPTGLPESLLKIGAVERWSERLDTISIDGRFGAPPAPAPPIAVRNRLAWDLPPARVPFTDAVADMIVRLPKLRRLAVNDTSFTESGLARLADAASLCELSLRGDGLTVAGLKHLARLRGLTALQLDGFGVDDAAIDQLNGLRSLEELSLLRTTASRAQFHDLAELQCLYIDCLGTQSGIDVPIYLHVPLGEVASMKPEEVPKDGFWHPEIRLANLPKLKHLLLSGVTLGNAGAEEIERLPVLETLLLTECRGDGHASLVLENSDKLRSVAIGGTVFSEIRLGNLPHLTAAEISHDEKLTRLSLARLPQIHSIQMDDVPSLGKLEISDGINLDRLVLSPLLGFDSQFAWSQRKPGLARPVRFQAPGLARLANLDSLALPDRKIDLATLDEINHLTEMTSLDLSGTWLSDSDLARLNSLAKLEHLNLSGTDITADGLSALSKLPRLQTLDLTNTFVVDGDDGLVRLKSSLPNLSITGEEFSGEDQVLQNAVESSNDGKGGASALWCQPSWIPSMTVTDQSLACLDVLDRLPALNLWGCHVTDAGLDHVRKTTHLQALNLNGTHITDAGLARLSGLKSLESLSLAGTLIQGTGLKHLENLCNLKSLDLSDCDITDDDLANLKYVPNLERLWLAGTKITDAGLPHLVILRKLRSLDISQTHVSDDGLVHLEALARLESLGLNECLIQGADVVRLRWLERLRRLDLSNTPLNEAGLEQLTHMDHLQELVLEGVVVPETVRRKLPALQTNVSTAATRLKWSGDAQYESLERLRLEEQRIRDDFWSGLFPPGGNQMPSRPRN